MKSYNGHVARKRFGQNFLHDQHVIEQIVNAINLGSGDHVVEVGPGMGAITQPLLQAVDQHPDARLSVIEIDRDLADQLRLRVSALDNDQLGVICADALRYDFAELAGHGQIRVVGNLPYNISTPLLFHLMDFSPLIADMYFMLQKEVVERITALPNTKAYGRLSVMMQYATKVSPLFNVPRGAFKPVPKVESAVFCMRPYSVKPIQAVDEAVFARMVRDAFSQRRKTLRAIFKKQLSADQLSDCGIDPMARPENLSVSDFVKLADKMYHASR